MLYITVLNAIFIPYYPASFAISAQYIPKMDSANICPPPVEGLVKILNSVITSSADTPTYSGYLDIMSLTWGEIAEILVVMSDHYISKCQFRAGTVV